MLTANNRTPLPKQIIYVRKWYCCRGRYIKQQRHHSIKVIVKYTTFCKTLAFANKAEEFLITRLSYCAV